jgi:hypothetical protein
MNNDDWQYPPPGLCREVMRPFLLAPAAGLLLCAAAPPGGYDYDSAWTWALAMTREQRRARLKALSGA